MTVLIIEVAVRFLPSPYDAGEGMPTEQADALLKCDKSLGWTGTPNFQGVVEESEFRANLNFNSLGLHDTEHSLQKESNAFRIFMLGDSFVHALQVDETVTSHQVLEDYLNRRKRANPTRFEVISGGVTSWGTGQQLIYYKEQGRHFKPDLVLLMLYLGNDFLDNLPGHVLTTKGFNCYAPYFGLCDGQLNSAPLKYAPGISNLWDNCSSVRRLLINTMGALYQSSHLYQHLDPLITLYHPRPSFDAALPNPFWTPYIPNNEVEFEQTWYITLGLISQLQREVEADGAQFAVAFFPGSTFIQISLLSPAEQELLLRENPAFAQIEPNFPNQRLVRFLSERNIPFIDLTDPLIEHQSVHDAPLYFFGNAHWTVDGNRFVAETLADWLVLSNLLPE